MKNFRKHLRLQNYNYSANGVYFITICTKGKEHYFGEIKNDSMFLSEYGHLAKQCWEDLNTYFPSISLDMFVIMPNHIHGIIHIENEISPDKFSSHQARTKEIIPLVIQNFKASVTRKGKIFFPEIPFVWQKSYHDKIIRDESSLENMREYIYNNPLNWAMDEENEKDIL